MQSEVVIIKDTFIKFTLNDFLITSHYFFDIIIKNIKREIHHGRL